MTAITTNARNLVLLLAILVLASACTVRFNTDVTLSEDDTATVNIVFGIRLEGEFPTEGAEGMEELDPEDSEADLQALSGQCGFDAGAVEAVEYNEDEFMGVEITLTDIPISAVNCFLGEDEDSPFEEFSITRDGDNYVFNGTAPPLGEAINDPSLGGQKRQVAQEEIEVPEIPSEALEDLGEDIEELGSELQDAFEGGLDEELDETFEELGDDLDQQFEDAFGGAAPEIEAEVRITFPGGVGDNNADRVEGNTAIWELNLEEPTTMMAVGAAGGGDNLLLFIIIGLVVVLLLVLIGVLVARSRSKSQQPAFGGPPGAGPQGGGFAGPPGAAPPPGGAPQQPGGFGGPPGGGQPQPPPQQQPGGFGGPPGGGQPQPPPQQQPGGFGGPPGGGQPQPPPQQPQPPQPQPEQPQQPPQPEQGGDAGSGGGFDPGSTRTFRPEDLLPPEEQGGDNR